MRKMVLLRPLILLSCIALMTWMFRGRVDAENQVAATQLKVAPEFTQTITAAWINSAPTRLADLQGKVVLIDFWTFACWNCYRSFPWLNELERRYQPQGLQVIGIHSPEFDYERERDKIVAKVKKFGLKHPIMIDNDHAYWRAMRNQYWPAFYLIDKQGRVRGQFVGETHAGDRQAQKIDKLLQSLLAE